MGRAVFQGIIFQHKFLNGVRKLIRNSETGYDYLFKNKRLLFQERWAIVFLLFCNLKIPKQGIKMQIFFLNRLWRLLKNGQLPIKLRSSAPWGNSFSTVEDSFSTVEVVQYSGGITSVQWGDSFSTVEGIQYIRGITSVHAGG